MTSVLDDYRYALPPGLIAQEPAQDRGASRLMIANRRDQSLTRSLFANIGQFLPPESLLVLNDAKVTPARLLGRRRGHPGLVELLILDPPLDQGPGILDLWCLGRPGRCLRPKTVLSFANGAIELRGEVIGALEGTGRRLVRFDFPDPPLAVLEALGHLPLPPYIKRPDRPQDFERYQTIYARNPGAIAAPTAGLHFTPALMEELGNRHPMAWINLRVGAGTFAPLTSKELSEGRLHEERVSVGQVAVEAILEAKKSNRRVVAVGTTTARALEWAAESGSLRPRDGLCDLFIRPGHEFRVVEALVTNFHLPASSLLLLVGAFMGREALMRAYGEAIAEKFRFYSYGDAMLVI